MKFYIGSSRKNSELVNCYVNALKNFGWEITYNWLENININETKKELKKIAIKEHQGIIDADVVIIILPAGIGTHVELGMALALNKKVFLCFKNEEDFNTQKMVAFYELPAIVNLVGDIKQNIQKIIQITNKNNFGEIDCDI